VISGVAELRAKCRDVKAAHVTRRRQLTRLDRHAVLNAGLALIAAGLLSVVIFPVLGLSLLRRGERPKGRMPTPATPVLSVEERELCGGVTSS